MVIRSLTVFLVLSFLSGNLICQEQDTVYKKKNLLQRMDSITNWKLERGRSTLVPFIAPSYTPETSVMLTLGGLYTFKISPDNKLLSRSSVPFSIGYSTNGSLLISIKANIYGLSDKLRFTGEYWNKNMPDNYWGVGYENGRHTQQSDSTTEYHRNWQQFKFKVAYKVANDFYIGVNYDYNSTVATEVNDSMAADYDYQKHGSDVFNSGFGLVWRYDSRDFPENAYKGVLFELAGTAYGKHTSSNNIFQVYEFDYRQYQKIIRKGSTLAWQMKTRLSYGDVPWTDLSMIGTPFDLRGYPWGQYRDYNSLFLLAEYRYMLPRKKPNGRGDMYGPLGFVVWGGTGSVTQEIGDFTYWIPNGGVGLRFEIMKRMNLRIDYGVGVNSSAFYISFNEAF
jgi:outer membrane protein assembly factor BamA